MVAFGRSEEKKAARAEARAAHQAEVDAAAFAKSPPGLAREAHARGDLFFQVEVPHSKVNGASIGIASSTKQVGVAPDVLGAITREGWRLAHAGWVYVVHGQDATAMMVTKGEVLGIYLFERA